MANLPADTRISLPEGGMVLWLQIPGIDALKLETEANKQEVDIRSGISFSTHDAYLDCIRINCGWPLIYSEDKISAYQQLIRLCQLIKVTWAFDSVLS